MSDDKIIKEQRDRYVAFAFASADLFIEISEDGKIIDVSGAAKGLTGIDQKALLKRNWLELFSTYEQARMEKLREDARAGVRIGPAVVTLNEQIGQNIAVLNAIKMPKNDRLYLALGVSNEFIAKIAPMIGLPGSNGFLDADNYGDIARDAIFDARLWGQEAVLTFFDFVSVHDLQSRFGQNGWGKVEKSIGELLAQYSFGGYSAGKLENGRYSFVHDKNINLEEIKAKILTLASQNGVELRPADMKDKTIGGNLQDISKKDLSRAVDFTLSSFKNQGGDSPLETLKDGFQNYMDANEIKLKQFMSIIERVSFTQFFQPVINLKTREATHYEILSRFEEGDSQEWIRFGEDAGLAPDFDLAVCERAINYIKFKAGGNRTKFSIDISGQSICNEDFFAKLKDQLGKHKGIADRLSFEITESANIEDLVKAGFHIRELQKEGFKVALDDFHPSAATRQYLQHIKADFVKLDGRYIRRITNSAREASLLRHLIETCQTAGIDIIAEGIEEKAQAEMVAGMGVKYAQGFLYGAPGPKPDYVVKS